MPELPEVETILRAIAPVFAAARIRRIQIRRRDLRFPLPEDFASRLEGARAITSQRRGKYMLVRFDQGQTLLWHLGMSGRVTIGANQPGALHHVRGLDPIHEHLRFEFENGAEIGFNDPRRFGYLDLVPTRKEAENRFLRGLGREPLDRGFTGAFLAKSFSTRRQSLKALLLDQSIAAGIGNIYACEALHRARLSPFREGSGLTAEGAQRLARAVRATLRQAIAAGGSSLRDYARANGELGYFQLSFRAYDREGAQCTTPGCQGVIARRTQNGRSSFFCPECQA